MSRYFGLFKPNNVRDYRVYQTDETIMDGRTLPTISARKLGELFTNGGSRNAGTTTIWNDSDYRLDHQNHNSTVHLHGYNINAVDFNNLSIQSGNNSLAVLYLEDDFPGVVNDVAGFRAPFTKLSANNTNHNDVHFLRMLYTWLYISNQTNRKICITSNSNFRVDNQNNHGIPLDTAKTEAKRYI